jgi:hypothetical protein
LELHFGNSRCHTAPVIQEQMKIVRCKRGLHPIYPSELAIADFYLFGQIKEELGTIQGWLEEKVMKAVTDISKRPAHPEMKNAFHHWVNRCKKCTI